MVRFIKVSEWISPVEEAASSQSEPMRTVGADEDGKGIRKIIENRHKVYTSS